MKIMFFIAVIIFMSLAGCAQSSNVKDQKPQHVGGICEGCEAIYESPIPFEQLNNIDTLPISMAGGLKLRSAGSYTNKTGRLPHPMLSFMYITRIKRVCIQPKETKKDGRKDTAISVAG
jgi:protocatechuate 3,4-dioxygenase beta subunit